MTDSRPCVVRPPSRAAGYFSLLAQKKVTKENGTLGSAPLAQRAVRCGRTGSAHRPSLACCRNRRDPSRRPRVARLVRSPFAASQRGPKSCPHPSPLPRAGEGTRRASTCASAAGTAALRSSRAPLGRGEQAQDQSRQRWPAGCRPVRREHRDVLPANPGACSRSHARRDARVTADARVSFLWLLSFGQAKESNRRPWMADDPHTDVSRSSRQRRKPKSKVKMDSGLRRNDDVWIPAFAGMTEVDGFRRPPETDKTEPPQTTPPRPMR